MSDLPRGTNDDAQQSSMNPPNFRQELDAILMRRDPVALRAFLVERGQWDEDTTMDPEVAMWMMLAASPKHAQYHAEAKRWLTTHGRGEDAAAIGGDQPASASPPRRAKPQHKRPPQHPSGGESPRG